MRIAIPTNDKKYIIYHLRFTQGFMIYEIEDGKIQNKYYRKLAKINGQDKGINDGTYARFVETLTDCDLIILYAMNSEMLYEFNKAGIDIFSTSAPELKGTIDLFLQGRLVNMS